MPLGVLQANGQVGGERDDRHRSCRASGRLHWPTCRSDTNVQFHDPDGNEDALDSAVVRTLAESVRALAPKLAEREGR